MYSIPVSQAVKYLHFIDIVLYKRDNQDTPLVAYALGSRFRKAELEIVGELEKLQFPLLPQTHKVRHQ